MLCYYFIKNSAKKFAIQTRLNQFVMQEIRELKNETTLSAIADNPDGNNHYLLFAIIIDISEPYKTEESTNYTTKLKIIDPSFNYKVDLEPKALKFHKFVHVNIYSETPDNAPKIQHVGDIVRLRRFKFKYTPKGELMGIMQKYSNWLIYSGNYNGGQLSTCFKNYPKNHDRILNDYERGRLADLRNWNNTFFFQNSLQYITWWTQCSSSQNSEKVDLILKCKKIEYKDNQLFFIDQDQNNYELTLNVAPNHIENSVIKLRCVNVEYKKNKPSVIKLTSLSSCLLVPDYFYDARKFKKLPKNKSMGQSAASLVEKFDFLKNYNTTNVSDKKTGKNLVSVVKQSHNDKKLVTLKEIEKQFKSSKKKKNQKFRISVDIVGVLETDPNKVIKVHDTAKGKILDFPKKQKKTKKNQKDQKESDKKVIVNLVFLVKDDSIKKNQTMNLYLTSRGKSDYHLFQTWNLLPQNDDLNVWDKVTAKNLKEFEKKLKDLQKPKYTAEFGVEIVKSKEGKPFMKVIDTVFLPLQFN